MLLAVITLTYPVPPDRPSDAWRLVNSGSPLPRVVPLWRDSEPDPAAPRARRLGSARGDWTYAPLNTS